MKIESIVLAQCLKRIQLPFHEQIWFYSDLLVDIFWDNALFTSFLLASILILDSWGNERSFQVTILIGLGWCLKIFIFLQLSFSFFSFQIQYWCKMLQTSIFFLNMWILYYFDSFNQLNWLQVTNETFCAKLALNDPVDL